MLELDLTGGGPATAMSGPSAEPSALPGHARRSRGRSAGARLADWYELAKPRLNFLVLLTTVVGFAVASMGSGGGLDGFLLLHTMIGTAWTAAGAGVLNQWSERSADGRMRRTSRRPIPDGRVEASAALTFGLTLSAFGVAWLAATVNLVTASLGLFTLVTYCMVYTPLKRHTPWATVVGAVPGAVPPVMGVTAVLGEVTPLGGVLFAILFAWQMPHFYALALLYRDDYAAGGFAMLPVTHGTGVTGRRVVVWSVALLAAGWTPLATGIVTGPAAGAYAVLAGIAGLWFLRRAWACHRHPGDRVAARHVFLGSIVYLPVLLGALVVAARVSARTGGVGGVS